MASIEVGWSGDDSTFPTEALKIDGGEWRGVCYLQVRREQRPSVRRNAHYHLKLKISRASGAKISVARPATRLSWRKPLHTRKSRRGSTPATAPGRFHVRLFSLRRDYAAVVNM